MGSSNSVPSKYFAPILPFRSANHRHDSESVASPYFVLVNRQPQSLVLLYSDAQVQSIIARRLRQECKSAGNSNWSDGGRLMNDHSFEFALNLFDRSVSNLKLAQIFCRLLADLHTHGWRLICSSDLCSIEPRSTLFFRRHQRDLIDAASSFLGVLAGSSEIIRLIDFPSKLSLTLTTALENLPRVGDHLRIVGQEVGGGAGGHSTSQNIEGRTRRFIELLQTDGIDQKLLLTKVILKCFSHLYENGYDYYGAVNIDGNADLILFEKSGAATSQRPSQQYFAIDLPDDNNLRIINQPQSFLPQTFMSAINQHWSNGMSSARSLEPNCDVYSLNGRPWASGSSSISDQGTASQTENSEMQEALQARRFLSATFEMLHETNWRLIASVQLNRVNGGTSTFIFCPTGPGSARAITSRIPRNAWCLALMGTSAIYLINAFFMHRGSFRRLQLDMRSLIVNRWPRGLAQGDDDGRFRRFRLNGTPWRAYPFSTSLSRLRRAPDDHGPNEDLHSKSLVCVLLAAMEMRGHQLVCTASVTHKSENDNLLKCKSDCDSWFFVEQDDVEAAVPQPANAQSLMRSWLGIHDQAPASAQPAPSAPIAPTAPIVSLPTAPEDAVPAPEDIEGTPPPYPVDVHPPPSYLWAKWKGTQWK